MSGRLASHGGDAPRLMSGILRPCYLIIRLPAAADTSLSPHSSIILLGSPGHRLKARRPSDLPSLFFDKDSRTGDSHGLQVSPDPPYQSNSSQRLL